MSFVVRPIKNGEGAALLSLVRALGVSHGSQDRITATAENFEGALFCPAPLIGAFVVEAERSIVGTAVWHRSFSTFAGKEILYLEDLSVLPNYQGLGIGRALMKEIAKFAVAKNFPIVKWDVMEWNADGRRFYERLGAELDPGYVTCRWHGDALKAFAI